MVLVDTSVRMPYLRRDATAAAGVLQRWLDRGAPTATLERCLASRWRLEFGDPWQGAVLSAALLRRCRAAGVAVRVVSVEPRLGLP